eukprot:Skav205752  [mRNA]  locus=scaffold1412:56168:59670:- [translate_table: standard]
MLKIVSLAGDPLFQFPFEFDDTDDTPYTTAKDLVEMISSGNYGISPAPQCVSLTQEGRGLLSPHEIIQSDAVITYVLSDFKPYNEDEVALLHISVAEGRIQTVDMLLQALVNPNHMYNSSTALHAALSYRAWDEHIEVCGMMGTLLTAKCDANSLATSGLAPFTAAIRSRHHISAKIDIVTELIDAHANVNAVDASGYSPLQMAAYFGRTPLVRILIEQSANLDYQTTTIGPSNHHDDTQSAGLETALIYAASQGHLLTTHALLESKADPCLRDAQLRTWLDVAQGDFLRAGDRAALAGTVTCRDLPTLHRQSQAITAFTPIQSHSVTVPGQRIMATPERRKLFTSLSVAASSVAPSEMSEDPSEIIDPHGCLPLTSTPQAKPDPYRGAHDAEFLPDYDPVEASDSESDHANLDDLQDLEEKALELPTYQLFVWDGKPVYHSQLESPSTGKVVEVISMAAGFQTRNKKAPDWGLPAMAAAQTTPEQPLRAFQDGDPPIWNFEFSEQTNHYDISAAVAEVHQPLCDGFPFPLIECQLKFGENTGVRRYISHYMMDEARSLHDMQPPHGWGRPQTPDRLYQGLKIIRGSRTIHPFDTATGVVLVHETGVTVSGYSPNSAARMAIHIDAHFGAHLRQLPKRYDILAVSSNWTYLNMELRPVALVQPGAPPLPAGFRASARDPATVARVSRATLLQVKDLLEQARALARTMPYQQAFCILTEAAVRIDESEALVQLLSATEAHSEDVGVYGSLRLQSATHDSTM